jgi:hypothetical protein
MDDESKNIFENGDTAGSATNQKRAGVGVKAGPGSMIPERLMDWARSD